MQDANKTEMRPGAFLTVPLGTGKNWKMRELYAELGLEKSGKNETGETLLWKGGQYIHNSEYIERIYRRAFLE